MLLDGVKRKVIMDGVQWTANLGGGVSGIISMVVIKVSSMLKSSVSVHSGVKLSSFSNSGKSSLSAQHSGFRMMMVFSRSWKSRLSQ